MPDHAAMNYLNILAQRPSILGRASRKRLWPNGVDARGGSVWGSPEDEIARSPDVDRWINTYHRAVQEGDDYRRRAALKGVVDSNRADHAAAGVPVHAHLPLPQDFAASLVRPMVGLPAVHRQSALNNVVAAFEPDLKMLVAQQLGAQMSQHPGDVSDNVSPAYTAAPNSNGGAADVLLMSQKKPSGDVPGPRTPQQEADDRIAQDPIAGVAQPPAYGGDQAMNDLFGEDGLFGDWGWRPTVPPPSDPVARFIGELTRLYLTTGPLGIGKAGQAAKGGAEVVKGVAGAEKGAAVVAKGAGAEKGAAGAAKTAAKDGGNGSKVGTSKSSEMARPYTCQTSCHCYQIPGSGAKCPPFVVGAGSGPDTKTGCNIAKSVAGAQVPRGCGYRHCNCRCSQ